MSVCFFPSRINSFGADIPLRNIGGKVGLLPRSLEGVIDPYRPESVLTRRPQKKKKERMQSLEPFRGSDDQEVTSWLTAFEELFDAAKQEFEEHLTFVPLYLVGDAKQWYRIHRPYDSWSDFKTALVNAFTSSTQLYNRRQTLPESVQPHSFDVILKPADIFENSMMIRFDDICSTKDGPSYETFLLDRPFLHSQHELDYKENRKRNDVLKQFNHDAAFTKVLLQSPNENFETAWPEGEQLWFIHEVLPQRSQFVPYQQQVVLTTSTFNVIEDSVQEISSVGTCVALTLIQQPDEPIILPQQSLAWQLVSHFAMNTTLDFEKRRIRQLRSRPIGQSVKSSLLSGSYFQYVLNGINDFYNECSQSKTQIFSFEPTPVYANASFDSNILQLISIGIILIRFVFPSMEFVCKLVWYGINNFEWFRALAVP